MKTDHLQSVSSANLHVQPEYLIYQDFYFFNRYTRTVQNRK